MPHRTNNNTSQLTDFDQGVRRDQETGGGSPILTEATERRRLVLRLPALAGAVDCFPHLCRTAWFLAKPKSEYVPTASRLCIDVYDNAAVLTVVEQSTAPASAGRRSTKRRRSVASVKMGLPPPVSWSRRTP
ncbi:hypothetical protein MTO96_040345 [Rhipicephalus appendiculatus]